MTTHRITNANDVRSGNALPPNRAVLGIPTKNVVYEDLLNASGNPVVAQNTITSHVFVGAFIAASQAVAGAGFLTINGAWATGGVATVDWPRTIALVTNSASGNTTQTALISGTDIYGEPMSQLVTLNDETVVLTTKAFYEVTSIYLNGAITGNISVDVGESFGLSYKARLNGMEQVATSVMTSGVIAHSQSMDYPWYNNSGTATLGGTFVGYDDTSPATNLTGDVRGTYTPHATPDGATNNGLVYTLVYIADNGPNNSDGFGQPQV